jgi:molecular chaperone DnaK
VQTPRRKIAGIDLGTTYSAIAHFDEYGKATVIPNSDHERITPSVVLFDEGEAIVGKIAKNMAIANPTRVVQFVKRHMGEPGWHRDIDGHRFTPEVLSAIILKRLVQDAEDQLGDPITDVVITCPAYFNDIERRLTREAGRIAGLNVLGIVNEPTAAALAYGLNTTPKQHTALVFDLGGGTFDVTILEVAGNDIRVLATDGERRLGGKDWDDLLVERVAKEFERQHGMDPRQDPEALQDLIIRAEEAKKSLSSRSKAKLLLQAGGNLMRMDIPRETFEELTRPLLHRTEQALDVALRKAGLRDEDIDVVLPVGGSTRMPAVYDLLEHRFGARAGEWVPPDECVALGAAYWAAILLVREAQTLHESGDLSGVRAIESAVPEDLYVVLGDTKVQNVNSHSLGVMTVQKDGRRVNRVMIPEQSAIPCSITKEFATAYDGQGTVEVRILEGEGEDPESCTDLGRCVISGLPPGRPAGSRILLTYSYGEDGVVEVHAVDLDSGQDVKTEIQRNADVFGQDDVDLKGRKIKHLLDVGAAEDADPATQSYSEFMQNYDYSGYDQESGQGAASPYEDSQPYEDSPYEDPQPYGLESQEEQVIHDTSADLLNTQMEREILDSPGSSGDLDLLDSVDGDDFGLNLLDSLED